MSIHNSGNSYLLNASKAFSSLISILEQSGNKVRRSSPYDLDSLLFYTVYYPEYYPKNEFLDDLENLQT